jgi:uncharacterized protein
MATSCCRNEIPYVVPVHYAVKDGVIFVYTTEGKKTDIINQNPHVCLQIEDVADNRHWTSVIVDGVATQVSAPEERDLAIKLITQANPTLTPAISVHWKDLWVKENREVVYRIVPTATSGRAAGHQPGSFVPLKRNIL